MTLHSYTQAINALPVASAAAYARKKLSPWEVMESTLIESSAKDAENAQTIAAQVHCGL